MPLFDFIMVDILQSGASVQPEKMLLPCATATAEVTYVRELSESCPRAVTHTY